MPLGTARLFHRSWSRARRNSASCRFLIEDRYGDPIERKVCLEELSPGESYKLRIVDDSTLDPSFWQHYHEQVSITDTDTGCAVTVSETDRYRGFAFLGFRYFKIRRQLMGLKIWAESGKYRDIGMFERPFTQVGMAFVSTMLLWPFFGLTPTGLILSSMLTLVVAMHEFGHMFAFRIMGHKSARMIFIPILGGIALGGRPYDRHFEVGFSALLGAGFSVFPVTAAIAFYPVAVSHGWNGLAACLAAFGMIGAVFNLANLVPVWKFDGGQVIRQVFTNKWAQAASSFVLLGCAAFDRSVCRLFGLRAAAGRRGVCADEPDDQRPVLQAAPCAGADDRARASRDSGGAGGNVHCPRVGDDLGLGPVQLDRSRPLRFQTQFISPSALRR